MTTEETLLDLAWAQELERRFAEGLPHRRHLRRLVRNILKDDGLTEDVLQEVHTAAWLHVRTGGVIEDTKRWLSRAARNRALDYVRKRRREVPLENHHMGETVAKRYED